jgi:hypothetical protein
VGLPNVYLILIPKIAGKKVFNLVSETVQGPICNIFLFGLV